MEYSATLSNYMYNFRNIPGTKPRWLIPCKGISLSNARYEGTSVNKVANVDVNIVEWSKGVELSKVR
jgi:hypothetical protein